MSIKTPGVLQVAFSSTPPLELSIDLTTAVQVASGVK